MLLGLSLFWVGAVLFLNGLWVLRKVGDQEIAVIDVFVGTLTLAVAVYLAFGPSSNAESIKGAAFLLLFTFTYYWVAWNRWNGADGRGLGWFCLFVAITCAPISLESLSATVTGNTVDQSGKHNTGSVSTGATSLNAGAGVFSGVQTASLNSGFGSANQAATSISATGSVSFTH